jgi:peptidyl-prolyl cis-trans isomerase B (cyclophilin B)
MPTEKQRREAERRRLQRRLQRRAQREARRRRFALIASIVGALVVIAIILTFVVATGNDDKSGHPAAAKKPTASTCTWQSTGNPARKGITKPPVNPPKTGRVNLLVQTSRGPMTFQLNRTAAPCTVASFVSLAQQNYFNSTPCHRLTTSGIYVLQCGDPTGSGSGGPGYKFADELSGSERYTRGVLAMANSGADTNGSQFFIVYKDSTLGPNYTIFGKVTSGLDVVDKVAAKGSDNSNGQGDGHPKLPISLTSMNVVE